MEEFNFEGLDELIAGMRNIEGLHKVRNILRKTVTNTAKESQRLVPVGWGRKYPAKTPAPRGYRGGTLKRSMLVTFPDPLQGIITYNTNYAAYQEYGTRFIPARYYLKTPFMDNKDKLISELKRVAGHD